MQEPSWSGWDLGYCFLLRVEKPEWFAVETIAPILLGVLASFSVKRIRGERSSAWFRKAANEKAAGTKVALACVVLLQVQNQQVANANVKALSMRGVLAGVVLLQFVVLSQDRKRTRLKLRVRAIASTPNQSRSPLGVIPLQLKHQ
jgi:hypothetical protein